MRKVALLTLACLAFAAAFERRQDAGASHVALEGAPASSPQFRDLEGRLHTPLALEGKKAVVFFFIMPDCPISNFYAPEMRRIAEEYAGKKVAAFVVHADPDVSAEQAGKHAKEYGLSLPVLLDPDHVLVKKTGVSMAPEAALWTPEAKTAYRGRIDDIYVDYGKRRVAPTRRDLREAIDALLGGRPIAASTTKVIGCHLPGPRKKAAPSAI